MPNKIKVFIDVKKLDKSRFIKGKPDQHGHEPLYADIILIPRKEIGKYGETHIAKMNKKKEETIELPIIGKGEEYTGQSAPAPQPHRQVAPPPPPLSNDGADSDVPF